MAQASTSSVGSMSEKKWWVRFCLKLPYLMFFGIALSAIGSVSSLYINLSYSLPGKLYVTNKLDRDLTERERGEIYSFKYYGEYLPHNLVVTKRIVGVPGDVVTEQAGLFLINGQPVAQAKELSLTGQTLEVNPFRGVIPKGKFFFTGDHKDSFDSRYKLAGLGDVQDIVGRSYKLF